MLICMHVCMYVCMYGAPRGWFRGCALCLVGCVWFGRMLTGIRMSSQQQHLEPLLSGFCRMPRSLFVKRCSARTLLYSFGATE